MFKWLNNIFSHKENIKQEKDKLLDKIAYLTFDNGTTFSFNKKDLYCLSVEYTSPNKHIIGTSTNVPEKIKKNVYLVVSIKGQFDNTFCNIFGNKEYTHIMTPDGILTKEEFVSNKNGLFSKVAGNYLHNFLSLIDQGCIIYPPGLYLETLAKANMLPIKVTELKGDQLTESNYYKRYLIVANEVVVTVNKLDFSLIIDKLTEQVKDKKTVV